jgi:hypothetical protein
MTKRTIKSPKGLLTNEILAWGDPRNPLRTVEVIEDAEGRPEKRIKIMGPDPQEAIKGYIGFWRKWACIIIKYEGGDPARYYEILSGRKNPKPSDEDVNLRLVPVPATGRYKLKRDGAAKGRGTSDSSEVEIPVELDSKYAAAKLLCHLDDVEKCLRSLQIAGEQNPTVWKAIHQALLTATYAHQLTIVENEEAIDFGVNKRPQGAKKGGKARAEQVKEDNRERDIDMSVAYDSAKIKSECVKKLADKNKLSERATYKAISRGRKLRTEPRQSSKKMP